MLPLPAGREARSGVGAARYERHRPKRTLIYLVIKIGIMFYVVEFMLRSMVSRWSVPTVSALWALGVIAVRGLVL